MSGCIEREMSKVIITLPTKIKHVEIFEQTVIGCFSCVNNRLAFNTQILLPNFLDFEMNVTKDFNYKIAYNLKIDNQKAKKKNNNNQNFKIGREQSIRSWDDQIITNRLHKR